MINLYVVSTPIGNLQDISLRAIDSLKKADIILCEDTRVSQKLLKYLKINKKLITYNNNVTSNVISNIISDMVNNQTVYALISDAGTPLISDPGYKLIQACKQNNIQYTAIPGPCAVINGLILSAFPINNFFFAGFIETADLKYVSSLNTTIVFYVSPHKLIKNLIKLKLYFPTQKVAVIREMTKVFEEIIEGTIDELIAYFSKKNPKGEYVLIIHPSKAKPINDLDKYCDLIKFLNTKFSKKEISEQLSKITNISKNEIYNFIKSLDI